MMRRGPGLRQGTTQPVNYTGSGLCVCGCHGTDAHPPAVEARLCQECAEERFIAWGALLDVLTDA